MQKNTPSLGRIVAMVVFALSCFGLLLFLWVSFGGSIPLRPHEYQVNVAFPEATTLAEEADVRIAGINVGKVKQKQLAKGGQRTLVKLEIDKAYAPIPKDSKAILRQKTLLGETYVELTPGDPHKGKLKEGQTLANSQVEPTVELDEIFQAFDKPTKRAFQQWIQENAKVINGRGLDLNDALGNLAGFAQNGAGVLKVLDDQGAALHRLVKNTGVVFGALNERQGQLRQLIVNSNNVFSATASRDKALAQVFEIFPTFEDESKATLARLQKFSTDTHPLVNDLKPVADKLQPTIDDVSKLAPELTSLFKTRLPPLIAVAKPNLPNAAKFLRGASPVFDGLHAFLPELNPILSYANYEQTVLAGFLTNGGPAAGYNGVDPPVNGVKLDTLSQFGIINDRSFGLQQTRPAYERANAYPLPNAYTRGPALGVPQESFDCSPAGGTKRDPDPDKKLLPCFVKPPELFNNKQYILLRRGFAPNKSTPGGLDGTRPARP